MQRYTHHTPFSRRGATQVVLVLLLAGMATMNAVAQQVPLFSTYYFNRFVMNPAFTGIDNEYRAFGLFRSQWGAMPGRPVTGGATAEGSFWKDRIGTGLYIMQDNIGIFQLTDASLAYAQKIKFAKDHQISVGIRGGAYFNRINFNDARAKDINDPSIGDRKPLAITYDFSVGIGYKWKGLLIGFSVPNVLQPSSSVSTSDTSKASYQHARHYTAYAQYKIDFAKGKFHLTPTVFMRKGPASLYQFDISALFDYNNFLFIGGGYRTSFGIVGMAAVNIRDMFTIAYAYDHTTKKVLSGNVGATHEVTFGFHLSTARAKKQPKELITEVTPIPCDTLAYQEMQAKIDTLSKAVEAANNNDSLKNELDKLSGSNRALTHTVDSLLNRLSNYNLLESFKSDGKLTLVGKSFTLDKIYFDTDKSILLPESRAQLDTLASLLQRLPQLEILIKGHTDNVASLEHNQKLSEARARAVLEYLVSKNIAPSRLSSRGFGELQPITDNDTPESRQLNRRVEFSITKE